MNEGIVRSKNKKSEKCVKRIPDKTTSFKWIFLLQHFRFCSIYLFCHDMTRSLLQRMCLIFQTKIAKTE